MSAMDKLFSRGHVQLLRELPPEQQTLVNSHPIKYFILWRVIFKSNSLSTPCRPVFDCSTRTPHNPDGSAGRCLNDAMCRGRTLPLNLIKMLLRFSIGLCAISGDIKNFYNCFELIPEDWHLQLFLWKEDMNPDNETVVAVVKTIIYGNTASVPQSEEGMRQFANYIRDSNPRLASFLTESRYVDDLNDSEPSHSTLDSLQADAD